MTKEAQEWLEGQHEICSICEKLFWAELDKWQDRALQAEELMYRAVVHGEYENLERFVAESLGEDKADGL